MKGIYKSSKDVSEPSNLNVSNTIVKKGQVKSNGLCPKKNYMVKTDENYVFLSGTIRPPYEREFSLQGVT